MRRVAVVAIVAVIAIGLFPSTRARGQTDPNAYTVAEVYVPSFDGTKLHGYVFRPAGATRTPVIVNFTPYDNTGGSIGGVGTNLAPNPLATPNVTAPSDLVSAGMFARGYSYVQVAMRGTGGSGGCFDLWGPATQRDGYSVVEWAAVQPWATSQIVTWGASAGGFSQIATMATHPPHLLAASLQIASVGSSESWTNGVQNTTGTLWGPAWEMNRLYPPSLLSPSEYVLNAMSRNATDPTCGAVQTIGAASEATSDYWQARDAIAGPAQTAGTPVLWMGGFNDYNAREPVYQQMFNSLSGPSWAFFGPWGHGAGTGPSGESFAKLTLDWYDHWVSGAPLAYQPRALIQSPDGTWRSESAWPPEDAASDTPLPLTPGSYVDTADNAEETQPPPSLNVAPTNPPVATGQGAWTFTQPLPHDVRIAGTVAITANVQTPVPVSLVGLVYDIDPAGNATFVAHGANRINSSGPASFTLYPQDWKFPAGHRVGLLLSSADVYWFLPSNTGATVSITGGTFTLPALRCQRTAATIDGVPNFIPRRVPAPFTVPADTVEPATMNAAPPPAAIAC